MTAAYHNHTKVSDILLEAGADFNDIVEVIDKFISPTTELSYLILKMTRLWAVMDRVMNFTKWNFFLFDTSKIMLISHIPFIFRCFHLIILCLKSCQWGSTINNAFIVAASRGNVEIISSLLARGAKIETKDEVIRHLNTLAQSSQLCFRIDSIHLSVILTPP